MWQWYARIVAVCLALPAAAQEAPRSPWALSLSETQWIETRLPLFVPNALEGNLRPRSNYMTTLGVTRDIGTYRLPVSVGSWEPSLRFEGEGTLSFHRGGQTHEEVTVGLMTRLPVTLAAEEASLGWSNGFSYALDAPAYERGPDGQRGVESVPFQYYMGFEVGFAPQGAPNIEVWSVAPPLWHLWGNLAFQHGVELPGCWDQNTVLGRPLGALYRCLENTFCDIKRVRAPKPSRYLWSGRRAQC